MNSGFRMAVTERNTTKVKSYVLAIALQMVVVPLVFALGLSSPTYPAMFPIGAVLGGLLFGLSMRWAGGCAAGVWYKLGSGSLGALAAILGIPLGAFVAARRSGPVTASKVSAVSASKHFSGGLGLGVGASLAAGCTVGHGLTGVPLLAPGSMLAIVSIFAGSAITSLWAQRGVSHALDQGERSS
jgi:uncharacterized membrane protein YedE/YeeE